jgi:uncharacterized protein with HEPN domain
MDERVKTWLSHIITAIEEIENYFRDTPKRFADFQHDTRTKRAVERGVEIIGEAMNRILKVNPDIHISHARKIIATRNYVAHGYDSLEDEAMWNIVINHLQPLKQEVEKLLRENETI